nr:immunoglobulin light chain junction region [Macaca mulatta]
CMQAIEFPWTF